MNTAVNTVLVSVLLAAGLAGAATAAPVTLVAAESGNYFRHMPAGGAYYWSSSVATGETVGPVVWDESGVFNNTTYSYRDYFVFKLSDLGYGSDSITGVTLQVTTGANYYVWGTMDVVASAYAANNSGTNYPAGTNVTVNPAYAEGMDANTTYTTYHLLDGGLYTDGPKTYTLDVTGAVKDAYANGLTYVWFTLYCTVQSNMAWQSYFATQYNATAAYQPQLTIVPEPAAMVLLMVGALAAGSRRQRG